MTSARCFQCGGIVAADAAMCPTCGAARPASPAAPAATPSPWPSGNDPTLLSQVQGWSWGAFALTWIWAFAHRLHAWGAGFVIASFLSFFLHPLGLVTLAGAIYLGIKGNELAWQQRPFRSLEEFRATERAWTIAAIIVLALYVVAIVAAIVLPLLAVLLLGGKMHGIPGAP